MLELEEEVRNRLNMDLGTWSKLQRFEMRIHVKELKSVNKRWAVGYNVNYKPG